jgi:hypothetical protein
VHRVTLTATAGAASAQTTLQVHPQPALLEVTPAAAALARGQAMQFTVRAFAADGEPLLASPEAFRWSAPAELGAIAVGGAFMASDGSSSGLVSVHHGAVSAAATVAVGGETQLVTDFESGAPWVLSVTPGGTPGEVTFSDTIAKSGRSSLMLRYDFSAGTGTRAVYALTRRALGSASVLRVWVRGDGNGAWLRARVRDGGGRSLLLTLARRVDWTDEWRELSVTMPPEAMAPLVLESIYVVETDAGRRPRGVLHLDDVRIDVPPALPIAATATPVRN